MQIRGGKKGLNGHIMMKKAFNIRKDFENKGFVLTLFNLKAIVFAALLSPFSWISDIKAQELFVSRGNTNEVLRYNGTTGVFIDAFVTAMSGGLNGPGSLVFRADAEVIIEDTIDEVEDLVDLGMIGQGQGKSLINNLESTQKSIDKGKVEQAIKKIQGSIKKRNKLIDKVAITPGEGQLLIDAPNNAIDQLSE